MCRSDHCTLTQSLALYTSEIALIIKNEIITKRRKISPVGCWGFFIIQLWAAPCYIILQHGGKWAAAFYTKHCRQRGSKKAESFTFAWRHHNRTAGVECQRKDTGRATAARPLPQLLLLVSHFTLCILLLKIIQRKSGLIRSAEQFAKCTRKYCRSDRENEKTRQPRGKQAMSKTNKLNSPGAETIAHCALMIPEQTAKWESCCGN